MAGSEGSDARSICKNYTQGRPCSFMSHMIFLTVQWAETPLRVHGPENRDYDVGRIVISRVEYGSVLLLA